MKWNCEFPFQIGTTSFILPDDYLPNVQYLSDKVQNIELLFFEVNDQSPLPKLSVINEIQNIGVKNRLSWTIHLPLDLSFSWEGKKKEKSIEKVIDVIQKTKILSPSVYILHLDDRKNLSGISSACWINQTIDALSTILRSSPINTKIAIENLPFYPPEWNDAIAKAVNVSFCIDIGHMRKAAIDPVSFLRKRLKKASIIHLYEIDGEKHRGLSNQSMETFQPIISLLTEINFQGILTLEVFSKQDFESSMDILKRVMQ